MWLSASWCPGTWLNIYWPNGALSLLRSRTERLMGAAVRGGQAGGRRAQGARSGSPLALYLSWDDNLTCKSQTTGCIFYFSQISNAVLNRVHLKK